MRIKSRIRTGDAIMPPAPKTCSVLEHRGRDRWGQYCERSLCGFLAGSGCCNPGRRIVGELVHGVQGDTRQDIDTGGPVIAQSAGDRAASWSRNTNGRIARAGRDLAGRRVAGGATTPAPATSHAATSRGSLRQVYRVRESNQFSAVTNQTASLCEGNAQIVAHRRLLGLSKAPDRLH